MRCFCRKLFCVIIRKTSLQRFTTVFSCTCNYNVKFLPGFPWYHKKMGLIVSAVFMMSHKKFGPDRFSRFDVYWIQTNKHPDRQAKFIYRLDTNKPTDISFSCSGHHVPRSLGHKLVRLWYITIQSDFSLSQHLSTCCSLLLYQLSFYQGV